MKPETRKRLIELAKAHRAGLDLSAAAALAAEVEEELVKAEREREELRSLFRAASGRLDAELVAGNSLRSKLAEVKAEREALAAQVRAFPVKARAAMAFYDEVRISSLHIRLLDGFDEFGDVSAQYQDSYGEIEALDFDGVQPSPKPTARDLLKELYALANGDEPEVSLGIRHHGCETQGEGDDCVVIQLLGKVAAFLGRGATQTEAPTRGVDLATGPDVHVERVYSVVEEPPAKVAAALRLAEAVDAEHRRFELPGSALNECCCASCRTGCLAAYRGARKNT